MSQGPVRILLVEDDPAFATFVSTMLAGATPEHHVTTAASLSEAAAVARPGDVDAVLLDLGLPDSSGLDSVSAFSTRHPAVPLIVLTSNADERLASAALQVGAQDYVRKHEVSPELLTRAIRYAIERQRAAQALRHKEATLAAVFDASPLPIVVIDVHRHVQMWNMAAERLFGWTAAEVAGGPVPYGDPDGGYERRLRALFAGGVIAGEDRRAVRKDGAVIDVQVFAAPLIDETGRAISAVAMYQDITGQKRAERGLRFLNEASALLNPAELEGTLRGIATLAASTLADGAAVLLVDETSHLTHFYTAHRDAEVHTWIDRAAREIRLEGRALPSALEEVLESGQAHLASEIAPGARERYAGAELASLRPDLFRSAIIVPLATAGAPFGLFVMTSQGTERTFDAHDLHTAQDLAKRVALSIENARLVHEARELFEADLTGNFVALADGRIVACNRAFAEMIRLAHDQVIGSRFDVLLAGDEDWPLLVRDLGSRGRVTAVEMDLAAPDGRRLRVLLSATAVSDEHGQVTHVRGQLYDLTAHKRIELQLSQSQKMEAVGRLAGGIAHDFNNLLTIIGGQAERLHQGLPAEHELRRSAEAVLQAADRAAGLTQQLLAFSRRQVLAPRVLSLNDLVSNLHGMLTRLIGEDIQCVTRLAPDLGSVRADRSGVEQALLNLAVNSRDAMPSGGTLVIATANATLSDADGQEMFTVVPGPYVRLSVTDTGVGMDAETRGQAFEPFFTTKEVGKGTGLGLSMVYGVVKQSGGYIWVESEPGQGTTISIYLPVVQGAAEEVSERPRLASTGGTETVLLVEDEDGVRELLEEILRMHGYRVFSADRGARALEISDGLDEELHLLVTDLVMPHMSGRELATRLLARRPGVRVLFLSGYTDDARRKHGLLEGGTAFLQKPFATTELMRKVREVLDSR